MATHPTTNQLPGFQPAKFSPQATEEVAECIDDCQSPKPGRTSPLGRTASGTILYRGALLLLILWCCDRCGDLAAVWLFEPAGQIETQPGRYVVSGKTGDAEVDRALGVVEGASQSLSADRMTLDRQARQHLLDLTLFAEGRGMHASPTEGTLYQWLMFHDGWKGRFLRNAISQKTGVSFVSPPAAVGFHEQLWQGRHVPVQGCAVCHSGKVLGMIVPGLGNKNIDPAQLARLSMELQDVMIAVPLSKDADVDAQRLTAGAREFCGRVSNPRLANQTQGMVSVSAIREWFVRQVDKADGTSASISAVKVPMLWGYGEKRASGMFCDGMGIGPGWLAAVELVAGQTPETVRAMLPAIERVETSFGHLLPPAYPLPIEWSRVESGRAVFEANCSQCHGTYLKDERRLPIFASPSFVDLDVVGTDSDRVEGNTPEFIAAVNASPLNDCLTFRKDYRPGYLAPRLEGIWARFPYLHNGSAPNIAALLERAQDRPVAFDLRDAGEVRGFDANRLGLNTPPNGSSEQRRLIERGIAGARDVYYTRRVGHSNQGHEFGVHCTADEKRDLIEYLKTL